MIEKTYIEQMAEFVSGINLEKIPVEVINKVKLCIIDALECCISPMTDIRGEAILKSIKKTEVGSVLIGTDQKADSCDAAYYNTAKGSITSRNDIQMDAGVHAGAVLIPTVLAACEEYNLSGKNMLEGVLAGYETMVRFGSFLTGRMNKAWRTTAVFSPVGAAFAASKAMGLPEKRIMSAASFACNNCSGFNEWALTGTGEDVFQNASGARNGLFSAKLAANGVLGCNSIIEGKNGLGNGFGITDGYEKLVSNFWKDWTIMRVAHKPIDSCIIVQAPCQCTAQLLKAHDNINYDNIDSITIEMGERQINHPGCSNKNINTLVQGIMSICLGVASTVVIGGCEKINWYPPIDEKTTKLMEKCNLIADDEITSSGKSSVRITIRLNNGKVFSHFQPSLIPLTEKEVYSKFHDTSVSRLGNEKTSKIENYIENLENLNSVRDLSSLLSI